MNYEKKIAIIGSGNIGTAIYRGLISKKLSPGQFFLTRRQSDLLAKYKAEGAQVGSDNNEAVQKSEIIILSVLPSQLKEILFEIKDSLDDSKILISIVTAYSISEIKTFTESKCPVVLAMPNTALSVGESMTCIAADKSDKAAIDITFDYFELVGKVLKIPENLIGGATILAACGVAFFMRYIRAASQGGIQVGFHAGDAQLIVAQTAKGASKLLLTTGNHPETEIDKVTTPMGCTIAGLNEMEHNGMSSALIKGIVASYNELSKLK
ncbi:MAG: pyrroline-5-carboxylate reductase [Bacteroidales bacterium]|nr:pyrroline-5-carboxylate reductase [Bacteroidales bacterium]MCF8390970.1 pyrroline-5-carboxylate reductase [Bacteroidales bacterium]